MQRKFSVAKSRFHSTLLDSILEGLLIPGTVYDALEGILKTISDGINESSTSSLNQRQYWILMTIYKWDEYQQIVRPSKSRYSPPSLLNTPQWLTWLADIRTIYFDVSQSTSEYVSNKSHIDMVNLEMGYMQTDAIFNSDIFANGTSDAIKKYLDSLATAIVNQPKDIPV